MLLKPSLRAGIISSPSVHCQVLEAPEIDTSPDPHIPQTHRESTFPIPFGAHSALMSFTGRTLTLMVRFPNRTGAMWRINHNKM